MNNELFLKRLSEVAEWTRPQTGPSGAKSINKRAKEAPEHPGPISELELAEMTDTEAEQYYERLMAWRESQPNNSVPPEITQLKIQPVDCEDCGQHCENGRRVETRLCSTGRPHWRTRCQVCDRYKDPATGKFTLTPKETHNYLLCYYRPKLGVYKSKYQPQPKETNSLTKDKLYKMIATDMGDNIIYSREPILDSNSDNNNK
jgi:hypothetical protein